MRMKSSVFGLQWFETEILIPTSFVWVLASLIDIRDGIWGYPEGSRCREGSAVQITLVLQEKYFNHVLNITYTIFIFILLDDVV